MPSWVQRKMNEASPNIELLFIEPYGDGYDPAIQSHRSSRGADDDVSALESQEQTPPTDSHSGHSEDDESVLLQHTSEEEEPCGPTEKNPSLESHLRRPFACFTRRMPQGWRFGVTLGAALSLCTLVTNIVVLAVTSAMAERENGHQSNIATIRQGDCSEMEHYQLGIHLAINVVSTLLLGASNYCMQCLSAPTREDVDRAHRRGMWVDIGVPSLKNFRFIKPIKLLFWCLLAVSSVPLHLLYNSTFFVSMTNNSYDIYFATEDFQKGGWFDTRAFLPQSNEGNLTVALSNGSTKTITWAYPYPHNPYPIQSRIKKLGLSENGSLFERRENPDCIQDYAKAPLHDRRNVILITSILPSENKDLDLDLEAISNYNYANYANYASKCEDNSSYPLISKDYRVVSCADNSSIFSVYPYISYTVASLDNANWFNWICSQNESYDQEIRPRSLCGDGYWQNVKSNGSQWTVWGFKIDYCISEKMENGCALNVAKSLLIVVIMFNAVKSVVLIIVAMKITDSPLTTIGDAAASFVRKRDPTTRGMCLLTKVDFSQPSTSATRLSRRMLLPKAFEAKEKRRSLAAGKTRWILAGFLTLICLATIGGLLGRAVQTLRTKFDRGGFLFIWELGLGTASPYNLITGWRLPSSGDSAVVSTVLVANLPQAILSVIYFLVNALVTNLSLAEEWSRYAYRRAALRVSQPQYGQRSTYFLQIPYRVAFPLMMFSSLLHWILSQSIFIVKVDGRDAAGGTFWLPDGASAITCGYSPLGMIITLLVAVGLMFFTAELGMRKLKPGIPLAGSCSAAISAACHGPEGTSECQPLMWGVIPGEEFETEDHTKVGHCALSNGSVEMPVSGNMYA